MDLLEYQAKELFREVGIPVLPSQTIANPRELKRLQIRYPVVLKSQVRVGGRGKAGGIRFVANTIDAIAAARTIFNLSILGEYPEFILAESRYNTEREFFLAIVLDYKLQRPVLLGSAQGGMNVASILENLQQVVVESEFSPFYARHLTLKMGLKGELIQSVSGIIEKMYRLFWEKDLDLIEINPLGMSATGELMALDGKITLNDYALARHPEVLTLTASSHSNQNESRTSATQLGVKTGLLANKTHDRQAYLSQIKSPESYPQDKQPEWLDWQEKKGNIAIICNSLDLALLSWDLICQEKGKPACCVVISEAKLYENLQEVLAKLLEWQGLKVVLVNILAEPQINQNIAQFFANYLQPTPEAQEKLTDNDSNGALSKNLTSNQTQPASPSPNQNLSAIKFVLRLINQPASDFSENLATTLYWTDSLEEAVKQTISLLKLK
jgi:succinyl-CoA synthetase beta subunit